LNVPYIAKVPASGKVRTVMLMKDMLHMLRAARAFDAAGLRALPAQVYFRASAQLSVTDFVDTVEGSELPHYTLRRWLVAAWHGKRHALDG